MYFEVIDNKSDCFGFYCEGQIFKDLSHIDQQRYCWTYHPLLESHDQIDYVFLYCDGKSINEVCPDHLKEDWEFLNKKFKAYFKSFYIAKISLEDNCFYDMVPESFLIEYFALKVKIIEHVVKTYPKPSNYDHLIDVTKVCNNISQHKVNIDTSSLDDRIADPMVKRAKIKYNNISPYVKYDIFGSKTGRLSTVPRSFPIHQIDREYRSIINPTNDWFLEIDFNGAELRTFLALAGKTQPTIDIHEWNVENIYDGRFDREEAKKKIFAWLYGETENRKAEEIYNKELVRAKYWNKEEEVVKTYWGREIKSDKHHSLSYIVQSTFADLVLKQMVKVFKLLEGKKSFIAFNIHDNIVIDLVDSDKYLLPKIVDVFSNTEFGRFLVNIKAGSNFGEMKNIKYVQTN